MTRVDQHAPAGELPPGLSRGGAAAFDKSGLLAEYASRYNVRTLVETGLYQGHGSGMDLAGRLRYIALDWQWPNVERAQQSGHEAYRGDSAVLLSWLLSTDGRDLDPDLGPRISPQPPCLFWLDAHALDEDEGAPQVCPLLGELDAILRWEHAPSSVVLIDDLWGFGSLRDWPTLDEVRERVGYLRWDRDETGGVMRLTPKR